MNPNLDQLRNDLGIVPDTVQNRMNVDQDDPIQRDDPVPQPTGVSVKWLTVAAIAIGIIIAL